MYGCIVRPLVSDIRHYIYKTMGLTIHPYIIKKNDLYFYLKVKKIKKTIYIKW